MATNKSKSDDTIDNPLLEEFLTDPKHQQQRDFMNALIDQRLSEKVKKAKDTTTNKGGTFLDNLINDFTGGLFETKNEDE